MSGKLLDRTGALMVGVMVLLMAGMCWTCWYFKEHQREGAVGVRLVPGEILNERGEQVRTNRVDLPVSVPGFTSMALPISTKELDWLPPDTDYGRRRYIAEDEKFFGDVTVVVMGKDRTSIHKPQYCLPGSGFNIQSEETIDLPLKLENGRDLRAQLIYADREMKREDGSTQRVRALYIYYFVTKDQTTPDHLDMLWRMSKGLVLSGEMERWGYVSFITWFLPGGEEAALARSKEFLARAIPTFQLPVSE